MFWIFVISSTVLLLYWKVINPLRHWERLGVRSIPISDSWKNIWNPFFYPNRIEHVYNYFPNDRYIGIYHITGPVLFLKDLDLIKSIFVKDFDHFTDHAQVLPDNGSTMFWSKNLVCLKGQNWRNMRSTLSPAFTSSKMKHMFQLITETAQQFANYFENKSSNLLHVDLKDIFARYSNDVIATCAYGVECNSMAQKENYFHTMVKKILNFGGFWNCFKIAIIFMMPKIAKILHVQLFAKEIYDFFDNLLKHAIHIREVKNIYRPDLIHLLMKAKNGNLKYEENYEGIKSTGFATVSESNVGIPRGSPKQELTMSDITIQAILLFFAGVESTSNLMSFMGYELSLNPDVQQRLYEEIRTTMESCGGKITYETLNKMTYLDMVICEALRKWPILGAVDRVCTNDYVIEPQKKHEVRIILKKGDRVWMPIWAIHHNPSYYPNPQKFDPERFSDENKHNIKPFTFLPFGTGPRNCIGSRFALMEAKAMFFHLLYKFEFVVSKDTPIPIVLNQNTFTISPKNNIFLNLKRREN